MQSKIYKLRDKRFFIFKKPLMNVCSYWKLLAFLQMKQDKSWIKSANELRELIFRWKKLR